MSKYTTEIRFICENEYNGEHSGFNSINEILTKVAPKVFNFDFPIFDESYRLPLEIKILRTYYTREICEETVGLWKLRLQTRLCNIMPYYNQLYKSAQLEFNPFYDVDLIRDHNVKNNGRATSDKTVGIITSQNENRTVNENTTLTTEEIGKNISKETTDTDTTNALTSNNKTQNKTTTNDTTETNKNANEWDKYSDTPQGTITNLDNSKYLTNARNKNGTENTNSTGNSTVNNNGSVDYTESNKGTIDTTINGTTDTNIKGNNKGNRTTTENATSNGTNNQTSKDINTATNIEEYLEHIRGKQSNTTYSEMLEKYRKTFLNIDKMVIDELSDLFFGLW